MVDAVVVVCVGCQVDFVRVDPDYWAVFVVQSFNLEVVSAVVVGLVEFGDGWEEWAGYVSEWVEEAPVDACCDDLDYDREGQEGELIVEDELDGRE